MVIICRETEIGLPFYTKLENLIMMDTKITEIDINEWQEYGNGGTARVYIKKMITLLY